MIIIILIELILLTALILSEKKHPYNNHPHWLKAIIRTVIMLPLIMIVLFNGMNVYNTIMLSAFILIIIADLTIIKSIIAGMVLFAIIHIGLTINYTILYQGYLIDNLQTIIFSASVGVLTYIALFFGKIKPEEQPMIIGYMALLCLEIYRALMTAMDDKAVYIILGTFLFYACDIQVIYLEKIKHHKYYQQINHALYYSGLVLLAISTGVL